MPPRGGDRQEETEEFISRAQELVVRLAAGARTGTERYLDEEYWVRSCGATAVFYASWQAKLALMLQLLLAEPGGQPGPLRFILTTRVELRFPPLDLRTADYGPLVAAIRYVFGKVLAACVFGQGDPLEHQARTDAAFDSLWSLQGADRMPTREMLQGLQAILRVAFGRYEEAVQSFESEYRYPLHKLESASRTIVKECYLLSRMAMGNADEDARFWARTYLALLKFDYHLWMVEDHLPAEVSLPEVVLLTWLYGRINSETAPSVPDLFESLAPRAVMNEMDAIRRA